MNTSHHQAARHRRKTHAARKASMLAIIKAQRKDGKGKERVAMSRNRQEVKKVEDSFDIQIIPVSQ